MPDAVVKEKDEHLALFLGMHRHDKERGAEADQLLLSNGAPRRGQDDELANELNEPARTVKRAEPSLTCSLV